MKDLQQSCLEATCERLYGPTTHVKQDCFQHYIRLAVALSGNVLKISRMENSQTLYFLPVQSSFLMIFSLLVQPEHTKTQLVAFAHFYTTLRVGLHYLCNYCTNSYRLLLDCFLASSSSD